MKLYTRPPPGRPPKPSFGPFPISKNHSLLIRIDFSNTGKSQVTDTYSKNDILMPWTLVRADTVVSHISSVYILPRLLTFIRFFDIYRVFW